MISATACACSAVGVGMLVGAIASSTGTASSATSRSAISTMRAFAELAQRGRRTGHEQVQPRDRHRAIRERLDDRESLRRSRSGRARIVDRDRERRHPLALQARSRPFALLTFGGEVLRDQRRDVALQRRTEARHRDRTGFETRERRTQLGRQRTAAERSTPSLGERDHASRRHAAARRQRRAQHLARRRLVVVGDPQAELDAARPAARAPRRARPRPRRASHQPAASPARAPRRRSPSCRRSAPARAHRHARALATAAARDSGSDPRPAA